MVSVAEPVATRVSVTVTPLAAAAGLMVLGVTVKMPVLLELTATLVAKFEICTCSVVVPAHTMSFFFTFSTTIGVPIISNGSVDTLFDSLSEPLSVPESVPESDPESVPESDPESPLSVAALLPLLVPGTKSLSNEPKRFVSDTVSLAFSPHKYSAK